MDDLEGMTTGQRVRHFRERAGMTRPVRIHETCYQNGVIPHV
ncbi:MAG: hypothetical protein ACT4NY_00290 [Pseudonocardiales bacterium]